MDLNKLLSIVAVVLVIIGAVNWGLHGLFDYDLVHMIFGTVPVLAKIVYVLIGLSGLYVIILINKLTD